LCDELEGGVGGLELSEVLSLEVLEDVGFSGEVVVFGIQLSLETVSVALSLGHELGVGDEFLLNLVQFSGSQENSSLELSQLGVELNDSFVIGNDGGVLVSGLLVKGVDNLGSEVGEGLGDLSNSALIREVLL
jgi:hypothetical protein